ncbi:polynucleotide adenylyltransferase [Tulasnella sp. 424]|nr:polynucleotide adenylyltransferase [Tulasnella sp. 424]
MNGPSPKEEALTKSLMEELKRQNTFEDEDKIKNCAPPPRPLCHLPPLNTQLNIITISFQLNVGVPKAYVPIIKSKISGVGVDLLCARLELSSIPDDLELEDDKNLDERYVRSFGGRVGPKSIFGEMASHEMVTFR